MAYNLLGSVLPALAAANIVRALALHHTDTVGFYLSVAAASAASVVLNFLVVAYYQWAYRDDRSMNLRFFWGIRQVWR